MEISIIVVSYNTRELLTRCLRSLAPAAIGTPHEVVVVDNASRDGSVEMVQAEFPRVTCLTNTANWGFARAVNRGILASRGEFLVLFNSDAEASAGSFDDLAAFLRDHPSVGAVGPRTLLPDGRPCQSCFRFPNLIRPYLNFDVLRRISGNAFSLSYPWRSPVMQEGGEVDWLSGACLMLRRRALDQAGLLDEHFFMYFEDIDLCRRLHRAGWAVWYMPKISVVHRVGQSSQRDRERLRFELRRSCLHYFRTHHPGPVSFGVRAFVFGGALVRLVKNPRGATDRRIVRLALSRSLREEAP